MSFDYSSGPSDSKTTPAAITSSSEESSKESKERTARLWQSAQKAATELWEGDWKKNDKVIAAFHKHKQFYLSNVFSKETDTVKAVHHLAMYIACIPHFTELSNEQLTDNFISLWLTFLPYKVKHYDYNSLEMKIIMWTLMGKYIDSSQEK